MLKQIITLLVLSILIILFMSYAQQVLEWIVAAHNWVAQSLKDVFSGGFYGDLTRKLLALLSIPVFIGAIPLVAYYFTKRKWFPYFMQILWVTWLLETAVLVIQFKMG